MPNCFVFSVENPDNLAVAREHSRWAIPVWRSNNESFIGKALKHINKGDRCIFYVGKDAARVEHFQIGAPAYFELPAQVVKPPRELVVSDPNDAKSKLFGARYQLEFEIAPVSLTGARGPP